MKTILIVEDEAALLYALQSKFSIEGFTVLTADTAQGALKALQGAPPEIVVLDIMLPQGSGLDVLKSMKADDRLKNTKTVIMTNLTDDEHRKKAKELGVDAYLLKAEYAIDDIVEKIKRLSTP